MLLFESWDALAIVFNLIASVNVFKTYFVKPTLSTYCLVIGLAAGLTKFGCFCSAKINGLITLFTKFKNFTEMVAS